MPAAQSHLHLMPLSEVIAQFGVELRMLAASLNAVEQAVEHMTSATTSSDERAVFGMQNPDLIRQSLEALGSFAAGLSGIVPENWQVDTAAPTRSLTLDGLAGRLRFASDLGGGEAATSHCDFEMFD